MSSSYMERARDAVTEYRATRPQKGIDLLVGLMEELYERNAYGMWAEVRRVVPGEIYDAALAVYTDRRKPDVPCADHSSWCGSLGHDNSL